MDPNKPHSCEEIVHWQARSLGVLAVLFALATLSGFGMHETTGWARVGWELCAASDLVLGIVIHRLMVRMAFRHGELHGTMDSLARAFVRDINERRREESESPDGDRP